MPMKKNATSFLLAAWCVMGLAACQAPVVRTDVTVFHEWPSGAGTNTYAFAPDAQQQGSLEYKTYAEQIRQKLFGWGLQEKPASQANWLVTFTASVDNGTVVTTTDTSPVYVERCTPVYNRKRDRYENVCSQEYAGTQTNTSNHMVYRHQLALTMLDRKKQASGEKRNVYEGKVTAQSSCAQLNRLMPYLVQGLFRQFPGTNGGGMTVDIPVPQRQSASWLNFRDECD